MGDFKYPFNTLLLEIVRSMSNLEKELLPQPEMELTDSTCVHRIEFVVFDEDSGEEVCSACGVVVKQRIETIDVQENFKKFASEPDRQDLRRTSEMGTYGFSTIIDTRGKDVNGHAVNKDAMSSRMVLLQKQTALGTSEAKNLQKAIRVLNSLSDRLHLNRPVRDRASFIYRKAINKKLIRGRSIVGIMAACVYIACKESGVPLTLDGIHGMVGLGKGRQPNQKADDRNNVAVYFKLLSRELGVRIPVSAGSDYIPLVAQKCGLSERVARRAAELSAKFSQTHLSQGKSGLTIAAGCVYIASIEKGDERTTQVQVANATSLSTVTIRKRCYEIISALNLDINIVEESNRGRSAGSLAAEMTAAIEVSRRS